MLLSVIIPTFNRAHTLKRTLRSILSQEDSEMEIVVVDDGSTDGTSKVVEEYLRSKTFLHYYRLNENKGVNFARNFGFSKSKGDILIFLDSDDELMPNALNQIKRDFLRLNADLIAYNCLNSKTSKETTNITREKEAKYEEVLCGKLKGEMFQVIKRKIMNDGLRFPDYVNGVEALFWFEVWKKYKIFVSPKILRIYHTETSHSIMKEKMTSEKALSLGKARKKLIERFGRDLENLCPRRLAYFLYIAGLEIGMGGAKKEALSLLARSIKIKKSWKSRMAYLLLKTVGSDITRHIFSMKRNVKKLW